LLECNTIQAETLKLAKAFVAEQRKHFRVLLLVEKLAKTAHFNRSLGKSACSQAGLISSCSDSHFQAAWFCADGCECPSQDQSCSNDVHMYSLTKVIFDGGTNATFEDLYSVDSRLVSCSPKFFSCVWGAVRKNIISDRFSTKTAISAHI